MYNTILEELIVYSNSIISGETRACKKYIKACKRFLNDLQKMEHEESFSCYWDEIEAKKIVSWFSYMKHSKDVLAWTTKSTAAIKAFRRLNKPEETGTIDAESIACIECLKKDDDSYHTMWFNDSEVRVYIGSLRRLCDQWWFWRFSHFDIKGLFYFNLVNDKFKNGSNTRMVLQRLEM